MTSQTLTTQQVADRLGLTTSELHLLRLREGGLPIVQKGLQVFYRLEDVQAFEQQEVTALLAQVLANERPLPLVRAIASLVGLAARNAIGHQAPVAPPVEAVKPAQVMPTRAPPHGTPTPSRAPPARAVLSRPTTDLATLSWYLVHTKPRQEEIALTNLTRQGYECYMPMLKLEKLRQRKKTLIEEPMFPSYLFVRLDTSESGQSWAPIRSTLGVKQLVRFGGQPAKVDDGLVDTLHAREKAQQEQPERLFTPGEHVVVLEGPFAGIEAVYQMEDTEQRCMVLLEMLSNPVRMRIDAAGLRKIG